MINKLASSLLVVLAAGLTLLLLAPPAQALNSGDTKLFTALLAPSGATVYPIKSKDKNAHAYVAEFNPYNASVGRKKPKLGIQTLVADQYAIVAYYNKSKCLFASGGPRSDASRSGWSLTDCSGRPISKTDPRVGQFVLATLRYLAFAKSAPAAPPSWSPADEETSVFAIGDIYAAQIGGTDWGAMEAYALRSPNDPATAVNFAIHLVGQGKVRTISMDGEKVLIASDETLVSDDSDASIDNYAINDLDKKTLVPQPAENLLPDVPAEELTPEQEAREAKAQQKASAAWVWFAIGAVALVARFAPVIVAGGLASYRYAGVASRTAGRAGMVASRSRVLVANAQRRTYIATVTRSQMAAKKYGRAAYNACLRRGGTCAKIEKSRIYQAGRKAAGSDFMRHNRTHFTEIFGEGYCAFKSSAGLGKAASAFSQMGCDILHGANPNSNGMLKAKL